MSKVPKAQPWAKKCAPSWKPTPKDIFRHRDVIERAARRAGIRAGDVDDVVADVLGTAWLYLSTFKGDPRDPARSFRYWINAIAWRVARTRRVLEKKEKRVEIENLNEEALLYPPPHDQVVARFDLRLVGCLSPSYRAVAIQLALTGSLTVTADVLGIPLGTASTRVRALRRRLRKWGLR